MLSVQKITVFVWSCCWFFFLTRKLITALGNNVCFFFLPWKDRKISNLFLIFNFTLSRIYLREVVFLTIARKWLRVWLIWMAFYCGISQYMLLSSLKRCSSCVFSFVASFYSGENCFRVPYFDSVRGLVAISHKRVQNNR